MSNVELKKRLIESIQKTEDRRILEEAYRLLEIEIEASERYVFNDEQKSAILEARQQIQQGQYLSNDQANLEIDQWLNK